MAMSSLPLSSYRGDTPATAELPPLPPGWKIKTHPETGEEYYEHKAKKLTQWERPMPEVSPPSEGPGAPGPEAAATVVAEKEDSAKGATVAKKEEKESSLKPPGEDSDCLSPSVSSMHSDDDTSDVSANSGDEGKSTDRPSDPATLAVNLSQEHSSSCLSAEGSAEVEKKKKDASPRGRTDVPAIVVDDRDESSSLNLESAGEGSKQRQKGASLSPRDVSRESSVGGSSKSDSAEVSSDSDGGDDARGAGADKTRIQELERELETLRGSLKKQRDAQKASKASLDDKDDKIATLNRSIARLTKDAAKIDRLVAADHNKAKKIARLAKEAEKAREEVGELRKKLREASVEKEEFERQKERLSTQEETIKQLQVQLVAFLGSCDCSWWRLCAGKPLGEG